MSLYTDLKNFYGEVHGCIKGRGKSELAWQIINNAIEATQDGGTAFTIELDDDSKCVVNTKKLAEVLAIYEMDFVDLEVAGGGK